VVEVYFTIQTNKQKRETTQITYLGAGQQVSGTCGA
jgi:hypothetical protein